MITFSSNGSFQKVLINWSKWLKLDGLEIEVYSPSLSAGLRIPRIFLLSPDPTSRAVISVNRKITHQGFFTELSRLFLIKFNPDKRLSRKCSGLELLFQPIFLSGDQRVIFVSCASSKRLASLCTLSIFLCRGFWALTPIASNQHNSWANDVRQMSLECWMTLFSKTRALVWLVVSIDVVLLLDATYLGSDFPLYADHPTSGIGSLVLEEGGGGSSLKQKFGERGARGGDKFRKPTARRNRKGFRTPLWLRHCIRLLLK